MRIGLITRWNATCGISLHAEILGREFINLGHDIIVFAPTIDSAGRDWHHRHLDVEDEPWVYRVYVEVDNPLREPGYVNEDTICNEDYDVLVIEGYYRLPVLKLRQIIKRIQRKGVPVIMVLHEYNWERTKPLLLLPTNRIVVFDQRFIDEILIPNTKHILHKVKIIPYPVEKPINVESYRPAFAENKILFITFGRQPPEEYTDFIKALRIISRRYDIIYWIIRSDGKLDLDEPWIIQWIQRPSIETIYKYLKGSDIHLLPKSRVRNKVVVSSTVYQTIASGTPIVTPDTRYVETIPTDSNGVGAIIKYRNVEDLVEKIVRLIEDHEFREYVKLKALEFTEMYRSDKVARLYVELIKDVVHKALVVLKE